MGFESQDRRIPLRERLSLLRFKEGVRYLPMDDGSYVPLIEIRSPGNTVVIEGPGWADSTIDPNNPSLKGFLKLGYWPKKFGVPFGGNRMDRPPENESHIAAENWPGIKAFRRVFNEYRTETNEEEGGKQKPEIVLVGPSRAAILVIDGLEDSEGVEAAVLLNPAGCKRRRDKVRNLLSRYGRQTAKYITSSVREHGLQSLLSSLKSSKEATSDIPRSVREVIGIVRSDIIPKIYVHATVGGVLFTFILGDEDPVFNHNDTEQNVREGMHEMYVLEHGEDPPPDFVDSMIRFVRVPNGGHDLGWRKEYPYKIDEEIQTTKQLLGR